MQTRFTPRQLADPDVAASEQILRRCVHCGFCTATCPTYVLLGDELDSPRGRIDLIKDMLENDRPATREVVRHVDRCLSCLACMTTCPSGVHYQHLVDHARSHIEHTYRRPWPDRLLRALLARTLPYPRRFRLALRLANAARALRPVLPERLAAMLALAPRRLPAVPRQGDRAVYAAAAPRKARVALLKGCVQSVLAPRIEAATIRLLNRAGAEVVTVPGCCGAIVHHLGRDRDGKALASALVAHLQREPGVDTVVANASGCGTHVKDYGWLLRNDALAGPAADLAVRARDVTEVLLDLGLPEPRIEPGIAVAYHSACSMQHGQRLERPPRELLSRAGYVVREVREGHLCCGSAGTYNLLQPRIAARLRERKLANIERAGAAFVATGNIGCIAQLAPACVSPVVHTVELLDWATGGPAPDAAAD